jgi:hypothetical protein
MYARSIVVVSAVVLVVAACASQESAPDDDGTWVGTITTEGNVTTVVNESGSVWGGTATLVEEASIGVDAGPDEYMFGAVNSVVVADDRIHVADVQVPVVRAYGLDGSFIANIGGRGEGPGEYRRPVLLAVHPSGRLFIYDSSHRRINVCTAAGEPVDTWPLTISRCCLWPMFALGPDELWVHIRQRVEDPNGPGDLRFGLQSLGPEGLQGAVTWIPDLEFDQPTYDLHGHPVPTPFAPRVTWNAAPGGAVLFGVPDRYRFELLRADGTRLVVERYGEPVPLSAEQREWQRQFTVADEREYNEPEFSWDGASMPRHKPAYTWLGPTLSGEVWVRREGPSERVPDCVENPIEAGYRAALANRCWQSDFMLAVFAADGRYLGEVEVPPGMTALAGVATFVDAPMVVASFEDEAGTIMVKRYRLVLPGEE